MKCLACGKAFQGGVCPRCQFPEVMFPGDPEAALARLQPTIQRHRLDFLARVEVSLVVYHWAGRDGAVVRDREERLCFGSGAALRRRTRWLGRQFARLEGPETLTVRVLLDLDGEEREETVTLPNPPQAALQEVGAAVDEDFHLRLYVRSQGGEPASSGPVPLFQ